MYRDFNDPGNNHSILVDVRSKDISDESFLILNKLLDENIKFKNILTQSDNFETAKKKLRKWIMESLSSHQRASLHLGLFPDF